MNQDIMQNNDKRQKKKKSNDSFLFVLLHPGWLYLGWILSVDHCYK